MEYTNKINNGGLYLFRVKRRVVRGYKNLTNAERCPVELHKKYLSRVPKEVSDHAFYLRAFTKPRGEVWYHNKPMGRETLGYELKKIMTKPGFEGHLTNHSLE